MPDPPVVTNPHPYQGQQGLRSVPHPGSSHAAGLSPWNSQLSPLPALVPLEPPWPPIMGSGCGSEREHGKREEAGSYKAKARGPRHRKVPSTKHGWSAPAAPPGKRQKGGGGTGSRIYGPVRPPPVAPRGPPRVRGQDLEPGDSNLKLSVRTAFKAPGPGETAPAMALTGTGPVEAQRT